MTARLEAEERRGRLAKVLRHQLDIPASVLHSQYVRRTGEAVRRVLIGLAVLGGAVGVAFKVLGAKRSEWEGLTESEVRAKLEERIPTRVPDDKRAAVADRVVTKMRDRGALVDEATDPAQSPASDDGAVDSATSTLDDEVRAEPQD